MFGNKTLINIVLIIALVFHLGLGLGSVVIAETSDNMATSTEEAATSTEATDNGSDQSEGDDNATSTEEAATSTDEAVKDTSDSEEAATSTEASEMAALSTSISPINVNVKDVTDGRLDTFYTRSGYPVYVTFPNRPAGGHYNVYLLNTGTNQRYTPDDDYPTNNLPEDLYWSPNRPPLGTPEGNYKYEVEYIKNGQVVGYGLSAPFKIRDWPEFLIGFDKQPADPTKPAKYSPSDTVVADIDQVDPTADNFVVDIYAVYQHSSDRVLLEEDVVIPGGHLTKSYKISDIPFWNQGTAYYGILLCAVNDPNCGVRIPNTNSAGFVIESGSGHYVKVLAPNGGQIIKRGSIYGIQWQSTDGLTNVKIELLKGGAVVSTIANISNPANDGLEPVSYEWTIPANQTLGSDYRVRVTADTVLNTVLVDESDSNFSIVDTYEIVCTNLTEDMSNDGLSSDATKNGQVSRLQYFLVAYHQLHGLTGQFIPDSHQGYFGPYTEHDLKTFQTREGLATTGRTDAPTRAKIKQVSCGGTVDYDWNATFYDYNANHPDMNLPTSKWPDRTIQGPLDSGWDRDWYQDKYKVGTGLVGELNYPSDYFPLDYLGNDPADWPHNFHFGVHYRGYATVSTEGDYNYFLRSDDDSYVYVNGVLYENNSGLDPAHPPRTGSIHMKPGQYYVIDVFMAERHTNQSAIEFRFTTGGVVITPCDDDCPSNNGEITVTSPVAGALWPFQSSRTIRWNDTNSSNPSHYIAYAVQGSTRLGVIGVANGTQRELVWSSVGKINSGETILPLGDYKVEVCRDNNTICDDAPFKLVASNGGASVLVSQPAQGATLVKGNTYPVVWSITNPPSNLVAIDVDLVLATPGHTKVVSIGQNLPIGQTTLNWTVPTSVANGNYKVKVAYKDAQGDDMSAGTSGTFTITSGTGGNQAPVIHTFDGPSTLQRNQTGTWTIRATDPEGGLLNLTVYWGDWGTTTISNVVSGATTTMTHSYAQTGTFDIVLTVDDNAGNQTTAARTIQVTTGGSGNQNPIIDSISGPSKLKENQSGTWNIKATDPEGSNLRIRVTWGDGSEETKDGIDSGSTTGFSHSYDDEGDYTVTFIVTDDAGNQASATRNVDVDEDGGGGGGGGGGGCRDTKSPSAPLVFSTHKVGVSSTNENVIMTWLASDEGCAGIRGYSYSWTKDANTEPDDSVDTDDEILSHTLSQGTWWFHVKAIDRRDNVSETTHYGPIIISAAGSGGGGGGGGTRPRPRPTPAPITEEIATSTLDDLVIDEEFATTVEEDDRGFFGAAMAGLLGFLRGAWWWIILLILLALLIWNILRDRDEDEKEDQSKK